MKAARAKTTPTLALESSLAEAVGGPVCGVDEAGRGPWAGPVSAAAVILDPAKIPAGIDDSKALSAARREALEVAIKAQAIAWGVGVASVEEIDELNILKATGLAMRRAVEALAVTPKAALVDGNHRFDLPCKVTTVVGGDGLSLSIAAASILAKTARDRLMVELDADYPGYGFASHKGYNAPIHQAALRELGPCPAHRRTWAPIRALLDQV
ncbi:MAG: ribonuclease HII [Caulobacteraceae bacterium]|nr:ribonuclease HII [Caulobacteraceae bacterium]